MGSGGIKTTRIYISDYILAAILFSQVFPNAVALRIRPNTRCTFWVNYVMQKFKQMI